MVSHHTLKQNLKQIFSDYYTLCKPRVVALMLLTVLVGMYLATPTWVPVSILVTGLLGIGLCASSAATLNHLLDKRIDSVMLRTQNRPVAASRVSMKNAFIFAAVLGCSGIIILIAFVNSLTAILTFCTLIGYAGVYTGYLKRATPQNIVIGGLAGAAPPLLGWTAVTGHISAEACLLVLIIFTWTPPHFWALAIYRIDEYREAHIPMLPVTHGVPFTKLSILLYTILLIVVSVLPYIMGMSGIFYLISALILGGRFLYWAIRLKIETDRVCAMRTFRFSIVYLLGLFLCLLIDHYLPF